MKKFVTITIVVAAVSLSLVQTVQGVERFPPPDFEDSGHQLPVTTVPPPRAAVLEYFDVVVLTAALALASYLALKKRNRKWLFVLMLCSLVYFGFYREGCVCPIGAIQNITLALFDHTYAIPLTVIVFFALPLLFALFFGRAFCAAVCPLGAIQDVVLIHPLQVPHWLEQALSLLAYVYLGLAVLFAGTGSAFVICQYDPFVSFFHLSGDLNLLVLGVCFLIIGMFVGRPYCRYFCPYGVLLRMLSRVSKWRVTVTPDECVKCRLCEEACPFAAIEKPTTATTQSRRSGLGRLVAALVLLPVLAVGSGWLVSQLGEPFSRVHERVRLAERIHLENIGEIQETTDASEAFRATGQEAAKLYEEAARISEQFVAGSWLLGAFVGLVVGGKLIRLSVRRTREDYEADRGRCLACGRCFPYCPVERERLGEQVNTQ